MNPYASQLDDHDARAVIGQTAEQLKELIGRLGTEARKRPWAPGKWSAREIACHLADTEIAFAFRLRQALAEPHHTIQPFDQDAWSRPYSNLRVEDAVETFAALRRWNLALIDSLGEEAYSKPVLHPERGEMTFRTIIETMGGHDRNHLAQLEKLAAAP
jgi:hypothetical protein